MRIVHPRKIRTLRNYRPLPVTAPARGREFDDGVRERREPIHERVDVQLLEGVIYICTSARSLRGFRPAGVR